MATQLVAKIATGCFSTNSKTSETGTNPSSQ